MQHVSGICTVYPSKVNNPSDLKEKGVPCLRIAMVVLGLAIAPSLAVAADVIKVNPRPGVVLRILADVPADAKVLVLLFPGGAGKVRITDDGTIRGTKGNFLTRSRRLFVAGGIATALIDAPSDHMDKAGLTFPYRMTAEHAGDIAQVIARLRTDYPGRAIWLVGTSRGSTSAANAAANLTTGGPNGLVLTSTVGVSSRHGGNVLDFKLENITVPILVVHHVDDGCGITPISGARNIKARLGGATVSELMEIKGGSGGSGKTCGAKSHHGFLGIEQRVVDAISAWIKSH